MVTRVVAGVLSLLMAGPAQLAGAVPASAGAELKEPVRGLLDRQGPAPAAYESVVGGFVVRVPWARLQPTQEPGTNHGGELDPAAITAALAAPRAAGKPVRLRVTAGTDAPEWAKGLGGHEPMPWYADGASIGTIGRFWTTEFGTAYGNLQERLAALYDDDPRIREVVVARCTTEFAEPYTRQTNQLTLNRPALEAAGYTAAADEACHQEEINAHQVWQRTRSYLAFNPYQRIDETTWTGAVDLPFTKDMIDFCRQALGSRCVLGNNSLDPDRPAPYQQMYAYLASKGGPISYQTATAAKVCAGQSPCPPALWNATLDLALEYGAGAVELPATANGYTSWSLDEVPPYHGLRHYDAALEAAP
jgi:hypothetical protein